MRRNLYLSLILLLLPLSFTLGQAKKDLKYSGFFDSYYYEGPWTFTLGVGASGYNGDLCGGLDCNKISPYFGIGAQYRILPRIVLGSSFNYLSIGANDEVAERNLTFDANIYEVNLYGRFEIIYDRIIRQNDINNDPKRVKPFFSLGVSPSIYTANSEYTEEPENLQLEDVEDVGYPRLGIFIPFGLGVDIFISNRVSLVVEATYRYTFSDVLDEVSTRGNEGTNDSYATFGITLQYAPWAKRMKPKKAEIDPEKVKFIEDSSYVPFYKRDWHKQYPGQYKKDEYHYDPGAYEEDGEYPEVEYGDEEDTEGIPEEEETEEDEYGFDEEGAEEETEEKDDGATDWGDSW